MRTKALHPDFGVEVHGVDLRNVTESSGYRKIRAIFEEHSLLLFRNQDVDADTHTRLCRLFGPMEDRSQGKKVPDPNDMGGVTNVNADGTIAAEDDLRVLNLKANMLWHTDSTFLPAPALINMIVARVVPSTGGATEFASTRAAFESFEPSLQKELENTYLWHRYSHSRAKISPTLAEQELFTMWPDQCWRAVWENPANGLKSLYVASHAYRVEGMDEDRGRALIEELTERATKPEAVYAHFWRVGDVIVWDERAVLHRGTPWPYREQRTLDSYCVTARDCDGLASVRPGSGSVSDAGQSL